MSVLIVILVVAALVFVAVRYRRRNNANVLAQLRKHRSAPAFANAAYVTSEQSQQKWTTSMNSTYISAEVEAVYQDGDVPIYAVPLEGGAGIANVYPVATDDGKGSQKYMYQHLNAAYSQTPLKPVQHGYYTVETPRSLRPNTVGVGGAILGAQSYDTRYDTVEGPQTYDTVESPKLYSIPSENGSMVMYAQADQVRSESDNYMEVGDDDGTSSQVYATATDNPALVHTAFYDVAAQGHDLATTLGAAASPGYQLATATPYPVGPETPKPAHVNDSVAQYDRASQEPQSPCSRA